MRKATDVHSVMPWSENWIANSQNRQIPRKSLNLQGWCLDYFQKNPEDCIQSRFTFSFSNRRPSADKGKSQIESGRGIRYVDSEMRVTDALQSVCSSMRQYRMLDVNEMKRVVRWDVLLESNDMDIVDDRGSSKLRDLCEDLIESRERDFVSAVRSGGPLEGACYGKKAPCGLKPLPCEVGTRSLNSNGTSPCWPCSKGEYQSSQGASSCALCPAGHGTPRRGAVKSEECSPQCTPGQESPTGLVPCTSCGLGSYQPSHGASACLRCPVGHSTKNVGANSVDECAQMCGDGVLARSETCDDGNLISGDGCSEKCEVEPGFECSSRRGPRMPQNCYRVGAKTNSLDDSHGGDNRGGISDRYLSRSKRKSGCGDGRRSSDEVCDDGNFASGDGCSELCTVEPGYTCVAAPAESSGHVADRCVNSCGDGRKSGSEHCDDGNRAAGDGCSEVCRVEEGWACKAVNGDVDSCRRASNRETSGRGRQSCLTGTDGVSVCFASIPCAHLNWSSNTSKKGAASGERYSAVCLPAPLHQVVWSCVSTEVSVTGACGRALAAVGDWFGVWQDAPQRRAQVRRLCGAMEASNSRMCLAAVVSHVARLAGMRPNVHLADTGFGGGSGIYDPCNQGQRLSADGRCVLDTSSTSSAEAMEAFKANGERAEGYARSAIAELECSLRMGRYYEWTAEGGCGCRGTATVGPSGCKPGGSPNVTGKAAIGLDQGGQANLTGEDAVMQWEEQDKACMNEAGPHYEHDGVDGCRCRSGYTSDASEDGRACRPGSHKLCRTAFGSTAEFDGVRACRCKAGHVPINGTCVRGSDAVCRRGPLGARLVHPPHRPLLSPAASLSLAVSMTSRHEMSLAWFASS